MPLGIFNQEPIEAKRGPKGDEGSGSLAKKPKPTPKADPKFDDGSGRRIFSPCDLKTGSGEGETYIQDWVVTKKDGGNGFQILTRSGQPYPETDNDTWQIKTTRVREAMKQAYIEFNFGVHYETGSTYEQKFCHDEAERLIPEFSAVGDQSFPLKDGPVQTLFLQQAKTRQNFGNIFTTSDARLREKMYRWSESPVMFNEASLAQERYVEAMMTNDMSKAVKSKGSPMFTGADLKSITNAMHRMPSELKNNVGEFIQTWKYSPSSNSIVRRDDGTFDELTLADIKEKGYNDVRNVMISKFVAFWFPKDNDVIKAGNDNTIEFGKWRSIEGLEMDPYKEAKVMIPEFIPEWGFMKHPVPLNTLAQKSDNVKRAYNFVRPSEETKYAGFDGLVKRLKMLRENLRVDNKKNGKFIQLSLPYDVLWTEDPEKMKEEYINEAKKKIRTPKVETRKLASGSNEDKNLPEYIKTLLATFEKRSKRAQTKKEEVLKVKEEDRKQKAESIRLEHDQLVLQEDTKLKEIYTRKSLDFDEMLRKQQEEPNDGQQAKTYASFYEQEEEQYLENKSIAKTKTFLRRLLEYNLTFTSKNTQRELERLKHIDKVSKYLNNKLDKKSGKTITEAEIDRLLKQRMDALLNSREYKLASEEQKADKLKRRRELDEEFRKLTTMSPENRVTALAPRKKEEYEKKNPYPARDWVDKMKYDEGRRDQYRSKMDLEGKKEFDRWVGMLLDNEPATELLSTPEAIKKRESGVYQMMYDEKEKIGDNTQKRSFQNLIRIVLCNALYQEYAKFEKNKKFEQLSPDEKKKMQRKKEAQERKKEYRELINAGDKKGAVELLYVGFMAKVKELKEERLRLRKEAVEEFRNMQSSVVDASKLSNEETREDTEYYDVIQFSDDVLDKMFQIEYTMDGKEKRAELSYHLDVARLTYNNADEIKKERKKINARWDEVARNRMRSIFTIDGVQELVATEVLDLAIAEDKMDAQKREVRELSQTIITKLKEAKGAVSSNSRTEEENAMRAVDISEEMEKINKIDSSIQLAKALTTYENQTFVAEKKVRSAFSKFLATVVEYETLYRAPDSNEQLRKAIENGDVKRAPAVLKEGLSLSDIADSFMDKNFVSDFPKPEDPKPRRQYNIEEYIKRVYKEEEDKLEKMLDREEKDREENEGYSSDEEDQKEGRAPFSQFYVPVAQYDKRDEVTVEGQATKDLQRIWKALKSVYTFEEWLERATTQFKNKQAEDKAYGLEVTELSNLELLGFIVETSIKTAPTMRSGEIEIDKLDDPFGSESKLEHEFMRIEPYRNTLNQVLYWDELLGDEVSASHPDAKPKITSAIHFDDEKLSKLSEEMQEKLQRYFFKNTYTKYDRKDEFNNFVQLFRWSVYKPWDETQVHDLERWNNAVKAYKEAFEEIYLDSILTITTVDKDGVITKELRDKQKVREVLTNYQDTYKFVQVTEDERIIAGFRPEDRIRKTDDENERLRKQQIKDAWDQCMAYIRIGFQGESDGRDEYGEDDVDDDEEDDADDEEDDVDDREYRGRRPLKELELGEEEEEGDYYDIVPDKNAEGPPSKRSDLAMSDEENDDEDGMDTDSNDGDEDAEDMGAESDMDDEDPRNGQINPDNEQSTDEDSDEDDGEVVSNNSDADDADDADDAEAFVVNIQSVYTKSPKVWWGSADAWWKGALTQL